MRLEVHGPRAKRSSYRIARPDVRYRERRQCAKLVLKCSCFGGLIEVQQRYESSRWPPLGVSKTAVTSGKLVEKRDRGFYVWRIVEKGEGAVCPLRVAQLYGG
jgi:hypothetical protein